MENLHGLDQAWSHSRYRPETGHLWLTTRTGGFWVLELEPQVRHALGLPERPTSNPRGGSPRPPDSYLAVDPFAGTTPCTAPSTLRPARCWPRHRSSSGGGSEVQAGAGLLEAAGRHRVDVALAQDDVVVAADLDLVAVLRG